MISNQLSLPITNLDAYAQSLGFQNAAMQLRAHYFPRARRIRFLMDNLPHVNTWGHPVTCTQVQPPETRMLVTFDTPEHSLVASNIKMTADLIGLKQAPEKKWFWIYYQTHSTIGEPGLKNRTKIQAAFYEKEGQPVIGGDGAIASFLKSFALPETIKRIYPQFVIVQHTQNAVFSVRTDDDQLRFMVSFTNKCDFHHLNYPTPSIIPFIFSPNTLKEVEQRAPQKASFEQLPHITLQYVDGAHSIKQAKKGEMILRNRLQEPFGPDFRFSSKAPPIDRDSGKTEKVRLRKIARHFLGS